MSIKKIKEQFPNKKLTLEELNWCLVFTGYCPLPQSLTDDVIDEETFLEMTEKAIDWIDDYTSDWKSGISYKKLDLAIYKEKFIARY